MPKAVKPVTFPPQPRKKNGMIDPAAPKIIAILLVHRFDRNDALVNSRSEFRVGAKPRENSLVPRCAAEPRVRSTHQFDGIAALGDYRRSAGHDQRDTRDARDQIAARRHLLYQYQRGERSDPQHVHGTHYEEKEHQRPAATQAGHTVVDAHEETPADAFPPAGHEEADRRAAAAQARVLPRRPLEHARDDQDDAAEGSAVELH